MTRKAFNGSDQATGNVSNANSAYPDLLNTVNTGGASTITFSNGDILVSCPGGGSDLWRFYWTITAADAHSARFYMNLASLPSQTQDIASFVTAAGVQTARIKLNSSNQVIVTNTLGVTLKTFSSTTISTNTWYRVEFAVVKGTGAGDGTIKCSVFLGDSVLPTEAGYSASNVNAGTTQTNRLQFGENSTTIITTARFDRVLWDNATSTLLGPYPWQKPITIGRAIQRSSTR